MFWVALSVLIMSLTGEGDDTYAFRMILEQGREAIEERVRDGARKKAALGVLDRAAQDFQKHRKRTSAISACLERADRSYTATEAEYQRCLADLRPTWDAAGEDLIAVERDFRAALSAEELAAVRNRAGY